MRARAVVASLAILGFVGVVVYGCGGSSSSSTGPSAGGGGSFSSGSGAVIQGQIVRVQSAALGESAVVVVLRTAFGIGVAEAASVGGLTVELRTSPGGALVDSTTTGAEGNFIFTHVPGGTYTIKVIDTAPDPDVVLVQDSPVSIEVGSGDTATISGRVTESKVMMNAIHVEAVDVSNLAQNKDQLCHAVSIASATGKNLKDVLDFRRGPDGVHGWGPTARHFGADPRVLGNNQCTEDQIADAATVAGGNVNDSGNDHGNGKGNSKGKKKG